MNPYPNWLEFDPDEKVRYFKGHPETYQQELAKVRDAYRLSPEELDCLKERLYKQMGLPKQSSQTRKGIDQILEGIRTILEGYEIDRVS